MQLSINRNRAHQTGFSSTSKREGVTSNWGSFRTLFHIFFIVLGMTIASQARAADDPIYTPLLNNNAVSGYDAVSYFQGGAPVKGDKKFSTDYMGARWLFSSQENLDTFQADPEKYAPQYGGYCAYAVALGSTAKGDPLQYHVDNGKLYLNVNANIKEKWLANKPDYIEKANANWPTVLD